MLNNILWLISLLLQIILLAALFSRNIPRRLPAFTTLIAFYPLRAALLFTLYGHLAPATYGGLYTNLALLDLILQAVVAVELTLHLLREPATQTRSKPLPRALALLPVVAAAAAATLLVVRQLPTTAPIPTDRAQTFLSFLYLGIFIWTTATTQSPLLRPITLGFALNASISLFSQTGHITAALHRDAQAYARWSYASAATYLIVVCLWYLTLKPQSPLPAQKIVESMPPGTSTPGE
ncbi:hypothetical protein BH10ACI4_BH10ACI4_26530 [soil metagenome]